MSGNGTDLGSIVAMLQRVLQAQEGMRGEMGALRGEMGALRAEMGALRGEMAALRSEHGQKLDDLANQIVTLRQTLTEYHASVLGHGILISELDARLRRVEQHLDLPPAA